MGIASDRMARLHRMDWEDYKRRFLPYQRKAADFATSDEVVGETLQRVQDSMDTGYRVALGAHERDMERYGLSESAREAKSREMSHQLDKTAETVSGLNQARLHVQDSQRRVLAGDAAAGLKESRSRE